MSQDQYAPRVFEPSLSHRFSVTFWFQNVIPIPSPLDFAFQRISGLSRELGVEQRSEGGENSRNNYLANKISHGSLVLERGVMAVTPLTGIFEHTMRGGKLLYCDVVISLLNDRSMPVANWALSNALPVSWKTDDFDASSSKVLISTLELRYQEMFWLGVRA